MDRPIYIFAGGGTGGHLYPALAVADDLGALAPGAQIVFACSRREIDRQILDPTPHAVVPQPTRPLPRSLRGWGAFARAWADTRRLARNMVADLRPAAVFGLSGYAAAGVVCAAARAGVRTGLLSIDAVPGLANRYLARRVDAVFAQFDATRAAYGRCAGKVRVVGCPVRRRLVDGDRGEARRLFGLRDDRKTLLVMAGSQGATNINDAVVALRGDLDTLAGDWQVMHLTGAGKADAVRAAYADAEIRHVACEFCDRMDLAYAAADLVLCRGGASTIGELSATGTPAVVMPYPHHRDRQQARNAAPLASAGAAAIVSDACDPVDNAEALRGTLIAVLADGSRLGAMRSAAGAATRPDAAAHIARWLAGQ